MNRSSSCRALCRVFQPGAAVLALHLTVIAAVPAVALPVVASETPRLVESMLENAPEAAEARCSYTRTKIEGDDSKRERFQAGASQTPWKLVSVDGHAPTARQLREYARDADDRDRRHPLAFDLRNMVDPEHWRQVSETGERATFEFRLKPNEDLDERLVDKVLGTLVVDKARHQPVSITIENTEPAYVAPFVRVAEYRQEMQFRWDKSVGAAVLTGTETRLRGRALGLKALREHKVVRYSEYECGPAETAEVAESGD